MSLYQPETVKQLSVSESRVSFFFMQEKKTLFVSLITAPPACCHLRTTSTVIRNLISDLNQGMTVNLCCQMYMISQLLDSSGHEFGDISAVIYTHCDMSSRKDRAIV